MGGVYYGGFGGTLGMGNMGLGFVLGYPDLGASRLGQI
jgi:hypothetical protein